MLNNVKSLFSLKKFIFFYLIMTACGFSQSWNQIHSTAIQNGLSMDLFANKDGNHIVVQYSGANSLIYYLVNTEGSIIRTTTIETSPGVTFPCIDGNNDKVYIVYKLGSIIKLKKSSNLGLTWTSYDLNTPAGSGYLFNDIDIVFDNIANKLHMVYSRGDFGTSNYITHYYALNSNNQWVEYKQVSDYGNEGTVPTVSFSQDRVHVSYHEDGTMARDKFGTTWQNPVTIPAYSIIERIHAGSSKLFYFYAELQPSLFLDLYVKQRNLNSSLWSSPELIHEHCDSYTPFVSATNTSDGKTHIVYDGPGNAIYRNYDGLAWSSEFTVGDNYVNPLISSVSNDLYVTWMGTNGYIKYRQYDANPLTPQNLQITHSQNNHPYLTWASNNEPDLHHYLVKKYDNGWTTFSTTATCYEDFTETFCNAPPPQQCNDGHSITYYVTAVDNNSHSSDISNGVKAYVNGGDPMKAIAQDPQTTTELYFNLEQNYPNPFNPATSISYSLRNPGFVTLKIYNMLGKEVERLVNEYQAEGNYSVEFNAKDLPSGIYVYKIDAGKFTDTKKMLLVK